MVRRVLAFDMVLGLISTQSIRPFVVPVLFALFLVIAVHCNVLRAARVTSLSLAFLNTLQLPQVTHFFFRKTLEWFTG